MNITDNQLSRLTEVGLTEEEARQIIRAEMAAVSRELSPAYGHLPGNHDLLDVAESNPPVTSDDTRKAEALRDELGDVLRQIAALSPSQQEEAAVFVFGSWEAFEAKFIAYQEANDPTIQQQLRTDEAEMARRLSDEAEIADIKAGKTSTTWSESHRKAASE